MIGYVNSLADYFSGKRPKKAQSIPASLFYRKDETMGIEGVPFDLFISEKHRLSFKVGDHPLQDGTTVSDHVQKDLREVTIEGMFTNHPMRRLEDTDEVKFKDDYATSEVRSTLGNRALTMFEKVKRLAEFKEPVRLVCSLETYPKMVITSIDYDRDAKSGSSIRFSMTLREVVTVKLKYATSSYTYTPDQMSSANDKLIASKKNSGQRSAEEKEADQMKELIYTEVVQ